MGAGPTVVVYDRRNARYLNGKLTAPILIICTAVALAGFMFGYDLGVSGAVASTEPFLKEFFPSVLHSIRSAKQDQFCVVDASALMSCVSSVYFAGTFSALMAGRLTTTAGRKGALIIGGIFFLIGACLQSIAVTREMLILGRVLVGFGLGFTNQAAPIYLAEIAPTKWRGAIGTGFYLLFGIGVFLGGMSTFLLIQFGENSWRFALSISAFPAFIMTIIAFFMPDTPSSLIQRGKVQEALQSLNQVRSVETDIDNELEYLINYHEATKNASEKPYQMLLERKYRPNLVLVITLPSFQLLTGIAVNWNLGPILDTTLAAAYKNIALVSLILGIIVILALFVATYVIDRFGRRILFIQAGIQIFVCQLALATLVASEIRKKENLVFTKDSATVAKFLTFAIGIAYSWSWGPLTWIVSTEILPMEVRAAGQGLSVAFNFLFQFLTIYMVFPMLCQFKYGTLLFYAGWVLIMTIFVMLFLPETKRISLESMDIIWRSHWYWHRFVEGATKKSEIS